MGWRGQAQDIAARQPRRDVALADRVLARALAPWRDHAAIDDTACVEFPGEFLPQPFVQSSSRAVENDELEIGMETGRVKVLAQAAANLVALIATGNADGDDGIPAFADDNRRFPEILDDLAAADPAVVRDDASRVQVRLAAPGVHPDAAVSTRLVAADVPIVQLLSAFVIVVRDASYIARLDGLAAISFCPQPTIHIHVVVAPADMSLVHPADVEKGRLVERIAPDTPLIVDRDEIVAFDATADQEVVGFDMVGEIGGKPSPRIVVGVDHTDDVTAGQTDRHVARMSCVEMRGLGRQVVAQPTACDLVTQLLPDPVAEPVFRVV